MAPGSRSTRPFPESRGTVTAHFPSLAVPAMTSVQARCRQATTAGGILRPGRSGAVHRGVGTGLRDGRELVGLSPNRRHQRAGAAAVAVLTEVDPLPGAECEGALAYRKGQGGAEQRRLDVGGHVVGTLERMGPVGSAFRDGLVEPSLEVAPHV